MTLRNLSITVPVGQAFERVKQVLFRPFDAGRWFIIGFCAWLATLGEGGFGGGGFNYGGGHHHGGHSVRQGVEQARDYVVANLVWILPLFIALALLILVVWLVVLWLSSRGRFMFLHCVALNVAEVRVPWERFAAEARSLFWFRVVLSFLGLAVMLPLAGGLFLMIMRMVIRQAPSPVGILLSLAITLLLVVLGVGFWIIGRFLRDFIVPLQFLRRSSCLDAWREFRGLLHGNVGNVVVYLLFRIVLAIGIALLVITVVLATCCIAGCLFALPYLGTVFLLPILVFERAYSLHYLAQFGPDYDVFSPPPAMVPEPPTA